MKRPTPWHIIWLAICLLAGGGVRPAAAQETEPPPTSTEAIGKVDYTFGQSLNFELDLVNEPLLTNITLFVSAPQLPNTYSAAFEIDAAAGAVLKLNHQIDLKQLRLPPFTTITYWWSILGNDGRYYEIPSQSFPYEDDTFDWKRRAEGRFEIFWTSDDTDLGQAAVDVGQETLPRMLEIIPGEGRDLIRVYLYPSVEDLQSALRLTGQTWVGGSASPELGVIMLPADNPRTAVVDLQRRLPHELSHLLLYEATGPAYRQIPRWLDEGLAALFETESNPNYEVALAEALADDTLIPLDQLCSWFPDNPEQVVFTAYAQSRDFVRYIQEQYGNQVLRELILAVKDGASCTGVTERVIGKPLAELEADWLARTRPRPAAGWQRYAFWVLLLLVSGGLIALIATSGRRPNLNS